MKCFEQLDFGNYWLLRHDFMRALPVPQNIIFAMHTLNETYEQYGYEGAVFPAVPYIGARVAYNNTPVKYSKESLLQRPHWYPYVAVSKTSKAAAAIHYSSTRQYLWEHYVLLNIGGKVFCDRPHKMRWSESYDYDFQVMEYTWQKHFGHDPTRDFTDKIGIRRIGAVYIASRNPDLAVKTIAMVSGVFAEVPKKPVIFIHWNGTPEDFTLVRAAMESRRSYRYCAIRRYSAQFSYSVAMNELYVAEQGFANPNIDGHILLLNDDFVLDPESLQKACRFMHNNVACGIQGGLWREFDTDRVCHAGVYAQRKGDKLRAAHLKDRRTVTHQPPWVTFACALIRRRCASDVFSNYGSLFDETFRGDCTDMDLCERARGMHYEIWMNSEFTGKHMVSHSRRQDNVKDNGNEIFFNRYGNNLKNIIPERLPCELSL